MRSLNVETNRATTNLDRFVEILANYRGQGSSDGLKLTKTVVTALGHICSKEQMNWVDVELVRNALRDLDSGVFSLRETIEYIKEVGVEDLEETVGIWPPVEG